MRFLVTAVLVGLSVLLPLLIAAQNTSTENWQASTLILHSGDSLNGEVDFRDWMTSPSSIKFRMSGNTTVYDSAKLRAFLVDGRMYRLVKARLKFYITMPIEDGLNAVTSEEDVAVYCEVQYSSPIVELYSMYDVNHDERMFIMIGTELRELVKYKVTRVRNGQLYVQTNYSYRDLLTYYLRDCDIKVSSHLTYSTREISSLLARYSRCKGYGPTLEKKKTLDLVNIGLTGGYVTASDRDIFSKPNSGSGYSFELSVQVLSPRNFNRGFAWLQLGAVSGLPVTFSKRTFSFQAGSYIGKDEGQPLVFIGMSNLLGIHAGAGFAINKRVVFTGSIKFLGREEATASSIQLRVYPRFRSRRE